MDAFFKFYDTAAVSVIYCMQRPVFDDMGPPFTFAACGRPQLS
jgi:hypothetical protein